MTRGAPELPAAYGLLHEPHVPCLRDAIITLAEQGAEEGTIMLVDEVDRLRDLRNQYRDMSPGNLHAALVLEPEIPPERDHELLYVSLVSLGNAIASLVAPMTALQFGWPNEVRIATHRVGEIALDRGPAQGGDAARRWVSVAATVFVASTPEADVDSTMNLHEAEGNRDIDRVTLFEHWAREFINWINLWDERGFAHVLRTWRSRADVVDCPVSVSAAGTTVSGVASGVDGHGSLVVVGADGAETALSPVTFLGWSPPSAIAS